MSQYGQRVVAIVEPTSNFSQQISALFTDVSQLTSRLDLLTADAPEVLDTLKELADAINTDPTFFTTMASANTTLQTNIDSEGTTRAAAVAALQSLVDAATAARTALSGRLDTLEVDPTTAAAVTAAVAVVQADVDANETERKTYFKWDSNLTKVINPLRSSEIEIGNNIHIDPAAGYATQFDGNVEFDNNTVLSHGGTDLTATFAEINAFDGRLDTLEADPTTKTYVDTQVTNLVDAAPGALDTLNELAAALGDDANFATTITNSIAAVQADVNQNETDADTALASLSTNLNNEGAVRLLADNALSGRLDTLEADPTTATALAAVQADVDQNETDADAAIALKAPLASPAFTGDVNFDSGAMFFKQSSGRLGLGTTNPGDSVHVHGGLIVQRSGGSSKIYLKQNTTDDGMTIQGQSNSANSIVLDTVGGSAGVKFTNNDHGTLATIGSTISLNKDVTMKLTSSVTPSDNLDMMVEATNNTTLTFKLKGDDGTVRSGTITLS